MKKYWQDIEELQSTDTKEKQPTHIKPNKDQVSIVDMLDQKKASSRRDFLKAFGFSIVSASVLASCERPVQKAIPYLIKPELSTPGKADYFASTFYDGEQYNSILVKVRDGRPIKIEGNELSSLSNGKTSAIVQGSVLELYDDNRIKKPAKNEQESTWEQIDAEILEKLNSLKEKNKRIALVTSSIISPSTKKVIKAFQQKYPNVEHIVYDPVSISGMLDANESTFGKRVIPGYHFENANVIVSFNADFLGNWIAPVEFAKGYIKNRKLDEGQEKMSRHIHLETTMSMTGSNADQRIPLKPSEEKVAIAALYNELLQQSGKGSRASLPEINVNVKPIAEELLNNKGKSLVVSGSNDPEVQILVNAINKELDSYGNTINFNTAYYTKQGSDKKFLSAMDDLLAGNYGGALFYNVNPVYDCPKPDEFKSALESLELGVSFAHAWDETATQVDYVCPDHHYLEAWNDANPRKGYYSLAQPTIAPIFDTRQFQSSLLKWSGSDIAYEDFIKNYWLTNLHGASNDFVNDVDFWNRSLQDGVFEITSNYSDTALSGNFSQLNDILSGLKAPGNDTEVHLFENINIGSGKHTNNPWLQETPDAVSKVTWDNYAAISPKFADENNLTTGDIIKINDSIEIPVLVQPGQAYGTISIAVGYGRQISGKAGKDVGVNIYKLVNVEEGYIDYSNNCSFSKTGERSSFAITQSHNSMEGRPIAREANLTEYLEDPGAGNELHEKVEHHLESLYDKRKFEGHHWGMVVDLNSCTGCNACVVGCTAENNVPVVGKEEVKRVHEMHWIRIDRYYSGDPENPNVSRQPVMCQHCDNAPCENVCPVAATTNSSEGVNQMAYNRCIGTRYCNNNCPYKVRRFNWFDYNKADALGNNTKDPAGMTLDLARMVLNPDVTVRAKGVMEKCSFCIQRVQEKKLQAKMEGRPVKDGEIKTACQQACATDAIVFGDMSDKNSLVTKLMKDHRNYHLLEELHTLPSVGYLTKIRNENV